MTKPEIQTHDVISGETSRHDMTDEQFAEMQAAGWPVKTDKDGIPE